MWSLIFIFFTVPALFLLFLSILILILTLAAAAALVIVVSVVVRVLLFGFVVPVGLVLVFRRSGGFVRGRRCRLFSRWIFFWNVVGFALDLLPLPHLGHGQQLEVGLVGGILWEDVVVVLLPACIRLKTEGKRQ